jgi:putative DNA primase/helicase
MGLRAAMNSAGLLYSGPLYADGKLHRFRAEGDHASNSWYVLHPDSPAVGVFGCWKRQLRGTWGDRAGKSPFKTGGFHADRQNSAEGEHRERMERQKKTLRQASWILAHSKPADGSHPYLRQKGVKPFGDLREWNNFLIVPLRNACNELQTIQLIAPAPRFGEDREKRDKCFLKGGRIIGGFFVLGSSQAECPLIICEGYATGASIHEAMGYEVVCAMNCGNLKTVAKAQRMKWRDRAMLIAADNDRWTDGNPGVRKAVEAARVAHAHVAIPYFRNPADHPTDFNDLHALEGLTEVRRQLDCAIRRMVRSGDSHPL